MSEKPELNPMYITWENLAVMLVYAGMIGGLGWVLITFSDAISYL